MLKTLDAEQFCSGHSEMTDRKAITNHINQMKKLQEKVQAFIKKNMTIEEIKKEFKEDETGLIEVIYNDIKKSSGVDF